MTLSESQREGLISGQDRSRTRLRLFCLRAYQQQDNTELLVCWHQRVIWSGAAAPTAAGRNVPWREQQGTADWTSDISGFVDEEFAIVYVVIAEVARLLSEGRMV